MSEQKEQPYKFEVLKVQPNIPFHISPKFDQKDTIYGKHVIRVYTAFLAIDEVGECELEVVTFVDDVKSYELMQTVLIETPLGSIEFDPNDIVNKPEIYSLPVTFLAKLNVKKPMINIDLLFRAGDEIYKANFVDQQPELDIISWINIATDQPATPYFAPNQHTFKEIEFTIKVT